MTGPNGAVRRATASAARRVSRSNGLMMARPSCGQKKLAAATAAPWLSQESYTSSAARDKRTMNYSLPSIPTRATGKIAWESAARGTASGKNHMEGGTGGGYAAPILASVGGAKQLIVLGGTAVYGMDPATGKNLWQEEWFT